MAQGPGHRHNAVATKAVQHRRPVVEDNVPGIAFKSTNTQGIPFVAPLLDAPTAATLIAIGEAFVIEVGGMHELLPASILPAGAVVGAPLWINVADNTLQAAAGAGRIKFGVIDRIDVPLTGTFAVNANLRDSF